MENDKKNIAGDEQSSFAGTNPDRHGQLKSPENQDNPIADQEAQNVTDGQPRTEGPDAERMRNKANEGKRDNSASER